TQLRDGGAAGVRLPQRVQLGRARPRRRDLDDHARHQPAAGARVPAAAARAKAEGRDLMASRSAAVPSESALMVRAVLSRIAFYLFVVVVSAFFGLPLLWLVLAPFDRHPSLDVKVPSGTLQNFRDVFHDPNAFTSLRNSVILAFATMAIVVATAALAAYALS